MLNHGKSKNLFPIIFLEEMVVTAAEAESKKTCSQH